MLAGLLLCGLVWALFLLDLPHPARPTRPPTSELTNSLGMKLRRIPPGTFLMGSPAGEDGRHDDEDLHDATISRAFFLGDREVTVGQFRAFVAATGYRTDAERDRNGGCAYDAKKSRFVRGTAYSWRNPGWEQTDDHSVVNVSWNDAVAFCAWLSRKEGGTYDLPTEAEWEYACRAGTLSRFATGEETESLLGAANVADASARRLFPSWTTTRGADGFVFTAPAGRFRPNAWGLYDMHGNVWEWCADWYGLYPRSAVRDPRGPSQGPGRILRGGSWFGSPRHCRSANRFHQPPSVSNVCFGFRVALRSLAGEPGRAFEAACQLHLLTQIAPCSGVFCLRGDPLVNRSFRWPTVLLLLTGCAVGVVVDRTGVLRAWEFLQEQLKQRQPVGVAAP
jgi:formylglycine-generating enzyme required for sulfatase activity